MFKLCSVDCSEVDSSTRLISSTPLGSGLEACSPEPERYGPRGSMKRVREMRKCCLNLKRYADFCSLSVSSQLHRSHFYCRSCPYIVVDMQLPRGASRPHQACESDGRLQRLIVISLVLVLDPFYFRSFVCDLGNSLPKWGSSCHAACERG
jgi:hypothetical protein